VSFRVIVTPTADAETLVAFRWYAERSPAAAGKWREGLTRAINRLSDHPERQPVSEENSEALGCQVRTLLHGRRRGVFRILYTIAGDTVWILRIRHSAQGPIEQ
jgi:plasmid stabilization system protein ParE